MSSRHCMVLTAAILVALAGLQPGSALAQSPPGTTGGTWELGIFGGWMDDRPRFEPHEGEARLAPERLAGGRLGYHFASRFFLEGEAFYAPTVMTLRADGGSRREELDPVFLTAGVGYNVPASSRLHLLLRLGGGVVRWDAGSEEEFDFLFSGGGGARIFLLPELALRTDARWHFAPSALATTRRSVSPGSDWVGNLLWLGEVTAGLSVFLGR